MSVAYQSWEVASGPTMGCNIAIQCKSNICAVLESLPPDPSSYNGSTFGSSESFLKAIANGSDMSNVLIPSIPKVLVQPDNVTRGFSCLSLHSPEEFEVSNGKRLDLNQLISNESAIPSASQSAQHHMQGSAPGFRNPTSFGPSLNSRSLSPLSTMRPRGSCLAMRPEGCHDFLKTYNNAKHTLDVVIEDKTLEDDSRRVCEGLGDDLEVDSLSSSSTHSISSLHDTPGDGCTSSGDVSGASGEAEVQSAYGELSSSSVGSSPPKKGLSRFYAGKSRSFSCLGDVVSLKDLAKPENPYAKKRKCNVGRSLNGRPQLPPLQKGVASISKRLPNNGKSTLALAMAMSAKEDENDMTREVGFWKCAGVERWQGIPLTSRSYSFSDLQGVRNRCISPS